MSTREAVGFTLCGVLIAALIFLVGSTAAKASFADDCTNFGKTRINSTWYECRKLEEK